MKTSLRAVITSARLLGAVRAIPQQQPSPPKTIADSINYMWKMVEGDFTSLAEACFRMGMSGSASFQTVRKSLYAVTSCPPTTLLESAKPE